MAAILRPRSRELWHPQQGPYWGPGSFEIDWSHPLSNKLRYAWFFVGGAPINLVRRDYWRLTAGSMGATNKGPGAVSTGGGIGFSSQRLRDPDINNWTCSLAGLYRYRTVDAAPTIFTMNGPADTRGIRFGRASFSSSTSPRTVTSPFSGAGGTTAGRFTHDTLDFEVYSVNGAVPEFTFHRGGQKLETTSITATDPSANANHNITLNTNANGLIEICHIYVYAQALSDHDAAWLYHDPFGFIKPVRARTHFQLASADTTIAPSKAALRLNPKGVTISAAAGDTTVGPITKAALRFNAKAVNTNIKREFTKVALRFNGKSVATNQIQGVTKASLRFNGKGLTTGGALVIGKAAARFLGKSVATVTNRQFTKSALRFSAKALQVAAPLFISIGKAAARFSGRAVTVAGGALRAIAVSTSRMPGPWKTLVARIGGVGSGGVNAKEEP